MKSIEFDMSYLRPTEVNGLIGDPFEMNETFSFTAKSNWKDLAKLRISTDFVNLKISS